MKVSTQVGFLVDGLLFLFGCYGQIGFLVESLLFWFACYGHKNISGKVAVNQWTTLLLACLIESDKLHSVSPVPTHMGAVANKDK